jgi:hypothetical protein
MMLPCEKKYAQIVHESTTNHFEQAAIAHTRQISISSVMSPPMESQSCIPCASAVALATKIALAVDPAGLAPSLFQKYSTCSNAIHHHKKAFSRYFIMQVNSAHTDG